MAIAGNDVPAISNELNAYCNGEHLFVYLTAGNGTIIVTDMLVQVVSKTEVSGNGYHENNAAAKLWHICGNTGIKRRDAV